MSSPLVSVVGVWGWGCGVVGLGGISARVTSLTMVAPEEMVVLMTGREGEIWP